jgi:Protein of unknown function (DUF3604)
VSGRHASGHTHAHMCGGLDHHRGEYTPRQQADLDIVLAFNRRMSDVINEGLDVRETESLLDPDPLRYMWVDEGQGRIGQVIGEAHQLLDRAPHLEGHHRRAVRVLDEAASAARPSVAASGHGLQVTSWVQWQPGRGDTVHALVEYDDGAGSRDGVHSGVQVVSGEVADVFRPTSLITSDGTPWVFFGQSNAGEVAVWATTLTSDGWSAPEVVSTSEHPSFNQEVVAHTDGRIELCWQGRNEGRFGIFSRQWADSTWGPTTLVTAGVEGNVWDPAVATFADGSTTFAWSEYRDGAYRVAIRHRGVDGTLHNPRYLTSGSDYALHPSLAVTADQQIWCAFDLITVTAHGGSGPTRLRAAAEVGSDPDEVEGMRESGDSIPPELLPDVSASIRVVAVSASGVQEAPGELAPRLDVVPGGLPKLSATSDGGLVVAYRVHRKLPLMTYYWEVATQVLAADGWQPPSTFSGTDGTLEEVSIAATTGGDVVLAATCDGRLANALQWTEGFGGRECPYLLEHQGSVIWHGIHGVGTVVTSRLPAAGPVPLMGGLNQAPAVPTFHAEERHEARRWSDAAGRARYVTSVRDHEYTLYWGDLHRHSLVSRCTAGDEPSLDDFYRYAWDVCEYDFWAVTDHSENSTDYQWWSIQKIADLFHIDGRFVPLYGFEWTSADSGHQNVIYGDVQRGAPIFSAFAEGSTDPAGLWDGLAQHPDYPAITIPHHPGSAMVYNDWDYHDPRYSRLVEIFQACRGNYEAPGAFRQYSDATREGTFVIDGLLRGHKFGLIASSDHGHGASYVGAFSESLDRGAVFDALHSRRTFAATTRDVLVDVRMGDTFLGEEVATDGPREFTVHAGGYTDLARVDLVRNGEVIRVVEAELAVPDGWLRVPLRLEWGESDQTTVWDGILRVNGGEIVQAPFWNPEVVLANTAEVAWVNVTKSFGEPYGAQRGGIELTVVGPPDAVVVVTVPGRHLEVTVAELARDAHRELPGAPGVFRLQPGIGALSSLEVASVDVTWVDDSWEADGAATAFYYVRVFQIDGEMAWSSPIWVQPAGS